MVERVTIAPCMGIGKAVAGVTRLAALIVGEDLLPGKTNILCIPALGAMVEEDIRFVEDYPTIVIDGCGERCASHLSLFYNIKPAAIVYVLDVVKETGLKPGKSRKILEDSGKLLAQKIAEKVAKIAEAILNDPNYDYKKQKMKDHGFEHENDIGSVMKYRKVTGSFYVPEGMPKIKLNRSEE